MFCVSGGATSMNMITGVGVGLPIGLAVGLAAGLAAGLIFVYKKCCKTGMFKKRFFNIQT